MKTKVTHIDSFGNIEETIHKGAFEINHGNSLCIVNNWGNYPTAIYAKPFWIKAELVDEV